MQGFSVNPFSGKKIPEIKFGKTFGFFAVILIPFISNQYLKIMYWSIPDIPDTIVARKNSKWNTPWVWLTVLALLFIAALIVVLWLKISPFYLLIPVGVWGAALLYRFILSMNRSAAADAWETEKSNIRKKWTDWAQRSIVLVDSHTILPDPLSLPDVITQASGGRNADLFLFPRDEDEDLWRSGYPYVAEHFYQKLSELAEYRQPVTLHIDAPDEEAYLNWQQRFEEIAEMAGIRATIKPLSDGESLMGDWVENRQFEGIHVIFSAWLNEDASDAEFTENATWLVFASPYAAKQNKLPVKAVLQRPIAISLSDETAQNKSFGHYADYALKNRTVHAAWFTAPPKDTQQYVGKLRQAGVSWNDNFDLPLIHTPEPYTGQLPRESHWLTLGLMAENSDQQNQLFGWQKDGNLYMGCLIHQNSAA
ncbi:hypothetical protein NEISICOT_03640 [Neisseria sicca ATCC 29256]|uniref:Uncharacterized protein n=2 Tax=Neisseria sicca TaxID=490 RepID=C6MAQ8_NEISI|nr:hypothetical protein NEISICOT_03640 [Neisseria sicca ATCC 29256]